METNKRVSVYENPLIDNLVLPNDTTSWYIKAEETTVLYIFHCFFKISWRLPLHIYFKLRYHYYTSTVVVSLSMAKMQRIAS